MFEGYVEYSNISLLESLGGLKGYESYSKVIREESLGWGHYLTLQAYVSGKIAHLSFSVSNWKTFSDLLNMPKCVYV